MSKGKCVFLILLVALTTFLSTSQFVYWVKPLDYFLPEGIDAITYFNYGDMLKLMAVGGLVFFTLNELWRAFKPSSLKLPRTSVRRRKGEPV